MRAARSRSATSGLAACATQAPSASSCKVGCAPGRRDATRSAPTSRLPSRAAPLAPTCYLQAWLEGRSLDGRSVLVSNPGKQEATASLVLGAELQPGLYRLRAWIACTTPQGVATTAELLLKAPSELNLRPVTGNDLLHREVVSQVELRRTVYPRHRERSVAIQGHKTDSSCVNTGIATAPSGASR